MKKALVLIVLLNFISCNEVMPSSFWFNYESSRIVNKLNDQGPWGGTLAINWNSNMDFRHNVNFVKSFAKQNKWELIDSLAFSKLDMDEITEVNNSLIRLPLRNFEPSPKEDNYVSKPLPLWIDSDFKLYIFKTPMLTVYSGSDDSTRENGFILLSNDKKSMSVYQIWGE